MANRAESKNEQKSDFFVDVIVAFIAFMIHVAYGLLVLKKKRKESLL